MSTHPSFLELDRLSAGGTDPGAHPHVAGCATCQQHLARLGQPVSVPAWALELGQPRQRRFWDGWGLRSLIAVGALAVLAVIVLPRVMETAGPGFQAKGGPAVSVHVKRGETVSVWRAGERLRKGDAVRLELSAQGFGQYAVLAREGARWVILSRGALATRPLLLPEAWRVDGVDPEELRVVFTRARVDDSTLMAAAEARPEGSEIHTVSLTLEKEAGQ